MNKVLVTGAAGFIGSHVCEALMEKGCNVIALDSFHNFYDVAIKKRNLEMVSARAGILDRRFFCVEGDIRDRELMERIFDGNRIDAVIHLAARAGVRPSIEEPETYVDVNIGGTCILLEAMRRHNVSKLVFASSSSVYGDSCTAPYSEDQPVDKAISPYAATKKAGEVLCHTYHHLYGIGIACLRFFTVYGPRQRPDLAIHKFTRLMSEGKPIPMFGDGSMSRDFTHIHDITDGVMQACDWLSNKGEYDIFNLWNSNPVRLLDLIHIIAREMKVPPVIEPLPEQPGDVQKTCADIAKSNRILGYAPKIELEKGIAGFIEWFKKNYY